MEKILFLSFFIFVFMTERNFNLLFFYLTGIRYMYIIMYIKCIYILKQYEYRKYMICTWETSCTM